MKNMMKLFVSAIIAVFLFTTTVGAQVTTKDVTVTVNKKGTKYFETNASGQKTFNFTISGLATQAELNAFATTFRAIAGVEKLDVSTTMTNSKWTATAIFSEKATKAFLANVLKKAGVTKIIIDGTSMTPSELLTFKAKSSDK